jgi:hypothetical protein
VKVVEGVDLIYGVGVGGVDDLFDQKTVQMALKKERKDN